MTYHRTSDEPIPDDLAVALHATANAAPPHGSDLAHIQRRGRARGRHRTMTFAGLAAAVTAVVAVATPVTLNAMGTQPPAGPAGHDAAVAAPTAPTQRLLLDGQGDLLTPPGTEPPAGLTPRQLYQHYRNQPGVSGVIAPMTEVLPDGTVVELGLALPGVDSVSEVVAMPNGRLAALGIVDRMPNVQRADGPCVEGLEFPLLIIERDRSISQSRDVRVRCETVALVAADAETAYLLRGSTLVVHDLATGQERALLKSPQVLPADHSGVSYVGGRVATLVAEPTDGQCATGGLSVRAADISSGATTDHPVPGDGCKDAAGPLRLSPDGRYAAVAYHRGHPDSAHQQLRLAILDLDRGTVLQDELITDTQTSAIAGIVWDDDRTLRAAWYEIPQQGGLHWLPDLIRVTKMSA